jgi:hypothetical protein
MTYNFCPESWWPFQRELQERGIAIADIEKIEILPQPVFSVPDVDTGTIVVIVTLESGRVESWRQRRDMAA